MGLIFFPARPEIDLLVVVLSRILPRVHTNSTRIQRWRNQQGFLSQGDGFHLKPVPVWLLTSSLATYTWSLHSCGVHFAAYASRRMRLGWHCWGPAMSLSPAAAGTGHLRFTGSVCKEYGLCWWGWEEAGRVRSRQQRGKENKQSERETGYLGKLQTSYLAGSQGHNTTSLANCPRHFFQLLPVSYGRECLPPSSVLPLVYFSITINKALTAFVQFLWTAA